ncbi:MAG: glycosyl hydrolase family 28-related protein [Planktothrix sp. GU0601_MAG3]|nr:MAG: glycosyl hydrolase family 28-related protein [Planktothrix sp. GU0601_MAG3]
MLSQQRIKRFIIFFLGTLIVMGVTVAGYAFTTLFLSNTATTESPISLAGCGSSQGGETDNAIATFYGNNTYSWGNKIRWNCVYNIKDFSGSNLVEQFNAARDAAFNHGGGVVYFPSGTYVFNDSIKLKSGVVLRGETPAIKSAKANNYYPPSKLVFPKYEPQLSGDGSPNETAFKSIQTLTPGQDSNIGIINLDINRAAINFVGDLDNAKNSNIIIFGVRSNNVAKPDPQVPKLEFQNPWQRYSHRFASNIELTGYENILVANNRINDNITDNYEQPGYQLQSQDKKTILTYQDGGKVPFNYSNHYGIVVNRGGKQGGFKLAGTPTTETRTI